MKPFLTPEQARQVRSALLEYWWSIGLGEKIEQALAELTIAPPKPKFRAGQVVMAGAGQCGCLPIVLTSETKFVEGKKSYRDYNGAWWWEGFLHPLTAAEIAGPEDQEVKP